MSNNNRTRLATQVKAAYQKKTPHHSLAHAAYTALQVPRLLPYLSLPLYHSDGVQVVGKIGQMEVQLKALIPQSRQQGG